MHLRIEPVRGYPCAGLFGKRVSRTGVVGVAVSDQDVLDVVKLAADRLHVLFNPLGVSGRTGIDKGERVPALNQVQRGPEGAGYLVDSLYDFHWIKLTIHGDFEPCRLALGPLLALCERLC